MLKSYGLNLVPFRFRDLTLCDTILAPPTSTGEHIMLFGKNSDRQRNEAQAVEYFPRAEHTSDIQRACTYITIPEASRTRATLICRPFWMWGAEMGANECGVVIGNEGLRAKSAAPQTEALTGMDLLRLALERASTAAEAVDVITQLLERYGQGGNCGHLTPSYYHNGFMIADAKDAFVLETIGREWLLQRICSTRAMSNRYSIENSPERFSSGLPALVRAAEWSAQNSPSYADVLADDSTEHLGNSITRMARSSSLMRLRDGRLDAGDMMRVLRDHGAGNDCHPEWRSECTTVRTLCMHAGTDSHPGQTVGSMVSELHEASAVHWVTGTAAPCISIFKPVLMDVPLPSQGPPVTDRFDLQTLWWRHERLHRAAVLGNFAAFVDEIRLERDELEADFRVRIRAVVSGGDVREKSQVMSQCWKAASEMEERWYARLRPTKESEDIAYSDSWKRMSALARIDPPFARQPRGRD